MSDQPFNINNGNTKLSECSHVPMQQSFSMDPDKLIDFVPLYEGESWKIYHFINSARQWLTLVGGNIPQNVMLLLSKLAGLAEMIISITDHKFNWEVIESTLEKECGNNYELNTLLTEILNVKKKETTEELLFNLKEKIIYVRSKLQDKYKDSKLAAEVMEPYVKLFQNAFQNSLFYHDKKYINCFTFNETEANVFQLEIIKECHLQNNQHAGIEIMYNQLEKYSWDHMQKQIKEFVLRCEFCKAVKYNRMLVVNPNAPKEPMEIWHINVMSIERQWYLTIIDEFSKYAVIKSTEKSKVYDTLAEVLAIIGAPNRIVHNTTETFCNNLRSKLFKSYNIFSHSTAHLHYDWNSDIRILHTTIQKLYRLKKDSNLSQNQKIIYITNSYNKTIHSAINKTPFEAHYGRKPKLHSCDNLKVAVQQ